MPTTRILSVIAALGLVLSPNQTTGQSTPTGSVGPKINVAFFANDAHDKPVSGVTQADVAVLDDKKAPQLIVGIKRQNGATFALGSTDRYQQLRKGRRSLSSWRPSCIGLLESGAKQY